MTAAEFGVGLAYDPVAHIAALGFRLLWTSLPPEIWGVTHFSARAVVLDECLTEAQVRGTAAHEVVHIERGAYRGTEPGFRFDEHGLPHAEQEEAECDRVAALRLVLFDELLDAAGRVDSVKMLASELNVDHPMMRRRLGLLTRRERAQLMRVAGFTHRCGQS